MHSVDRYHRITHNLNDARLNIPKKNFVEALFKLGNDKCVEYLGNGLSKEDLTFCRNEFMAASSCVLLYKANFQVGDFRDNVGLCAHEIKLAKEQLKQKFDNFPFEKMDEYLRTTSLTTKNFC